MNRRRTLLQSLGLALAAPAAALAQSAPADDADTLVAVLREHQGRNRDDDTPKRIVGLKEPGPDGKDGSEEVVWFDYLGDMHIRLVWEHKPAFVSVHQSDLLRMKLSAEQALQRGIANIRRLNGPPTASPWGDLMQVNGRSPTLASSYFLDREFWRGLLQAHPEGVVAAVPKRGGLLYTPLARSEAVEHLKKGIAVLHSSSGVLRVSSGLYLFKDDRWRVFQPPFQERA